MPRLDSLPRMIRLTAVLSMIHITTAQADFLIGFDDLNSPSTNSSDLADYEKPGFTGNLVYGNFSSSVLEGGWNPANATSTDASGTY